VTEQGGNAISGEVYQINSSHLAATDELECYPDLYQRVLISTTYGEAWMYIVEQSLCLDKPKLSGYWPRANDG